MWSTGSTCGSGAQLLLSSLSWAVEHSPFAPSLAIPGLVGVRLSVAIVLWEQGLALSTCWALASAYEASVASPRPRWGNPKYLRTLSNPQGGKLPLVENHCAKLSTIPTGGTVAPMGVKMGSCGTKETPLDITAIYSPLKCDSA